MTSPLYWRFSVKTACWLSKNGQLTSFFRRKSWWKNNWNSLKNRSRPGAALLSKQLYSCSYLPVPRSKNNFDTYRWIFSWLAFLFVTYRLFTRKHNEVFFNSTGLPWHYIRRNFLWRQIRWRYVLVKMNTLYISK